MYNNNLKRAMETDLSGLRMSQREKDAMLESVLTGQSYTMGRKSFPRLRIGFILTMMLTLLACGAIAAAILNAQQIVDHYVIPMANDDDDIFFTQDETKLLVRLAEENGLILSDTTRYNIEKMAAQGEGFYKDEMLKEIAKADFGQNIQAWTLAQKHWWDEACTAIGWGEGVENIMPEGGEDAKLPMIACAAAYVHAQYDADAPIQDATCYQTYVSYLDGTAFEDSAYDGLYWTITFDPLYLEGAYYALTLLDDQTVLDIQVRPGLSADMTAGEIFDRFVDLYGPTYYYATDLRTTKWTQQTFRDFQQAVLMSNDVNSPYYLCMQRTAFPDVPAHAISEEEAWDAALRFMGLEAYTNANRAILLEAKPNPVWKFELDIDNAQGEWERWSFEVDCITGEVLTKRLVNADTRLEKTYIKQWYDFARWEVVDEVEAIWNTWYEQWVEENSYG